MRQRVRIASIGVGWWGDVLATAAAKAGLEVASCYARSPDARAEFAARHGAVSAPSLDAVLDDPIIDGVVIATPHSTHVELVERAAAAGKHVFVEKPLALTVAAARRAVIAADGARVILQVGHMRRRQPAMRMLKRLVDSGDLGIIHLVEANLSYPRGLTPRAGWRSDRAESPAGGMTGLGVHLADNLIHLVGMPSRITAISKRIASVGALDDVTSALIEFESGPIGNLVTSMVIPDVARTAVHGTRAAAWVEHDGASFAVQRAGETEPVIERFEASDFDPVADELAEFAGCILAGSRPEVGGEEAVRVVAVLEAVVESAASGRTVEIDELLARSA